MSFKKSLTAAVAVLSLTGATLTTTSQAEARGLGGFIAAGIVGAVVGSVLASRSEAQPAYRPAYGPVAVPTAACPYGTHLGPQGHYCWNN